MLKVSYFDALNMVSPFIGGSADRFGDLSCVTIIPSLHIICALVENGV